MRIIILALILFFNSISLSFSSNDLPSDLNEFLNKSKSKKNIGLISVNNINKDHLSSFQWYLDVIDYYKGIEYYENFININDLPKIKIAVVEGGKFFEHPEYKHSLTSTPYYTKEKEGGKLFTYPTSEIYYSISELNEYKNKSSDTKKSWYELNKIINQSSINNLFFLHTGIKSYIDEPENKLYAEGNYESEQASKYLTKDHATIVTGLIASKHNRYGIKGICPFATIIPLSIISKNLKTNIMETIHPITALLEEVGPDIVNLSRRLAFNHPATNHPAIVEVEESWINSRRSYSGYCEYSEKNGKKYLTNKNGERLNIPVIIAAGKQKKNKRGNIDNQPITKQPFIAVGACLKNKHHAPGTRFGSQLIYAPGGGVGKEKKINQDMIPYYYENGIISTSFLNSDFYLANNGESVGGYDIKQSGSSLSTALVTGTIGLMLGINPLLNYENIINKLNKSTKYIKTDNILSSDKPKKAPKLLNVKTSLKTSFYTIIEFWRNYWIDYPEFTKKGFEKYYDNNSIIVRGTIKEKCIIYDIYTDNPYFNFQTEVHEPITKWMKNNNYNIKMQFNPIQSLQKFYERVTRLGYRYVRTEINLKYFQDTFEPPNYYFSNNAFNLIKQYNIPQPALNDLFLLKNKNFKSLDLYINELKKVIKDKNFIDKHILSLLDLSRKNGYCYHNGMDVMFYQKYMGWINPYSSPNYIDTGIKRLKLKRNNGNWFITKEIWFYHEPGRINEIL